MSASDNLAAVKRQFVSVRIADGGHLAGGQFHGSDDDGDIVLTQSGDGGIKVLNLQCHGRAIL